MRMTVSRPRGADNTLVLQGSAFGFVVGGRGVELIAGVGEATGVSVNTGVNVKVAVGGSGVAVGMAAWVCATIVEAAEIAVPCTSSALMVGTAGCPPQPLISVARTTAIVRVLNNFMRCLLLKLAVWITATKRPNLIISNYDVPTTFLNLESAKDFEALSSIYECTGAV